MFLRALQKVVFAERCSLKWTSFCRNGMKRIQHVKYSSNIQHPQKVIPDSITTDFVMVQKLVRQSQSSVDNFLLQCYEKEKDCFSYALSLMSQGNIYGRKSSAHLAYAIVHALSLWQESNGVSQPLTTELQTEALTTALSHQDRLLAELVCSVFKITNQCDFVYEVIENCVAQKMFEEAAICILVLKMQDKFPMAEVLVPLTFQGKISLVKRYVGQNAAMQLELVRLLDGALFPPSPSSPHQKLPMQNGKRLCKRLSDLLTSFKIPLENCPNLCQIRLKCSLNLLMRKRYSEQSISDVGWYEMVMVLVGDAPKLQKKLVFKLVEVNDLPAAFKMATKFEIPVDEWPPVLKPYKENSEMPNFSFRSETSQRMKVNGKSNVVNDCGVTEHLSLQLDTSCLKYIETTEQFEDSLNDISENYDIVGIDSEWKPSFVGHSRNRLSLLQLAVKDKVYLMDILALSACLEKSHWDDLMEKLFGNPKILKLGCGLISDVEIIIRNHQGTAGVPLKFSRLLDVAILFQKFQFACPGIVPGNRGTFFNNNNALLGLSKICSYVLGSPLKKEEQFSDWEVRPLRKTQLSYAALDAYCLIQIYDKLQELANEKNLDFHYFLRKSLRLSSEPPKESSELRKRMKWSKCDQGFEIHPVIYIKEFKVLLDYRLEELGWKLKIFGADVVSLPNSISCSEAFEMAKAEGRIILASSLLYEQFKDLGAEKICCNISENTVDDEFTVAYIFEKFNVRMSAQSISYPDQKDS